VIKRAKVHFRRYFVTGLLVIIPIWGTYLVLSTLLSVLEGLLGDLLKAHGRFYFPGMGIISLLVLIFVVGLLTANFLGKKIVAWWDRLLNRVPMVRSIYSAFKHVVDVVSLQGKDNFTRVVLIQCPRIGQYSIAFVTGVTEGEVQRLTPERLINVYVPTTPNPTSGYLLLVPETDVIPLSMSVEDGMKMIITGGLYSPASVEKPTGVRDAE
jgi:uncharacterized membrane protein